jgi:hypothetical protein
MLGFRNTFAWLTILCSSTTSLYGGPTCLAVQGPDFCSDITMGTAECLGLLAWSDQSHSSPSETLPPLATIWRGPATQSTGLRLSQGIAKGASVLNSRVLSNRRIGAKDLPCPITKSRKL